MILDSPVGFQKLRQALVEEGDCRWMYPDNKGWVSTGVGFKIDASGEPGKQGWEPALALPWQNVTPEWDVEKEWKKIKDMKADGENHPGQWFADKTLLRITSAEVQKHFERLARGKYATYKNSWRWYRDFDSFPGDAQLGVLARSWAELKPEYRFNRACYYRDWLWAAEESPYQKIVPTRRNTLWRLFVNAAVVESNSSYNRQEIYWPQDLGSPSTPPFHFRSLVRQPDWAGAFRFLNGQWIFVQLRMLDSLRAHELMRLWAMRGGVKASNPSWNWPRMEFAISVVWHGHLPDYSEDREGTASKLIEDDYTQAINFLRMRGLLPASTKKK